MIISVNTSAKNIEAANCILAQAIKALEENKDARKGLKLNSSHLRQAEQFRQSLIKAFIKQSN